MSANRGRLDVQRLLLMVTATPIWILLMAMVPNGTGFGDGPFRFIAAPLVLVGSAVAIQRLLRGMNNSWLVAGLAAGMIAWAGLFIAFWLQ